METIENILAVIGLVSLCFTVIRVIWVFFGSGIEWIDNVEIVETPYDPDAEYLDLGTGIYPTYYKDEEKELSPFVTATTITPQSAIIKKLKIKRIVESSINCSRLKYKTIKIIKNISPQFPLCVVVERGEAIAKYVIEWRIEYGAKATYYFYMNMRDGNNNRKGIEYSFGFFSKIRKLLDLK